MTRFFCTCLATLFLSTPVLAADSQQRNREAKKACLTGDFLRGVEILADLFIETNDPIHIFNQGRCLEQSHRWQDAADRFREYLRKSPNLDANHLADTNKHIADCEALIDREKEKGNGKAAPSPIQPAPPTPAVADPVQTSAPATLKSTAIAIPAESHAGSGLRTAGWVVGGVGVAVIAAAVVLNVKANTLADELWSKQSQAKASRHDTLETWAWASYGAGALLLATGATLFIWGLKAGETPADSAGLAFFPAVASDGATFKLAGGFQ